MTAACTKNEVPPPAQARARATTPAPSPAPGLPGHAARAVSGPSREVAFGSRDRREVALTFHGAGDPALAVGVLSALAAARAHVTVLAVGTWLDQHSELARRIVGAGHELGNHTWTHPVLANLGEPAAKVQIERCRDLLLRLTGTPGAHFRQSGGAHSTPLIRRLAGTAGYPVCLSYDVDSLDYTDPGPTAVRRKVAAEVRPGSIVSLHLGHAGTLRALPGVLADLDAKGLRPVTATTLLRP